VEKFPGVPLKLTISLSTIRSAVCLLRGHRWNFHGVLCYRCGKRAKLHYALQNTHWKVWVVNIAGDVPISGCGPTLGEAKLSFEEAWKTLLGRSYHGA